MEIKEAKEILESWKDYYKYINVINESTKKKVADTISALQLAIPALGKQVPKSPILDNPSKMRYVQTYTCPCCENGFSGTISEYCYHCGQALLWESEETK